MRIVVGPRRPIEVIVPSGTPDTAVETFLASKGGWIARKVAAAEEIARRPRLLGLEGKLWLQGESLRIEHVAGKTPRAELRDGVLRVSGEDSDAIDAIERWYRREARRRIGSVVDLEASRLGLCFNSLAIRDQKTRWAPARAEPTSPFPGASFFARQRSLTTSPSTSSCTCERRTTRRRSGTCLSPRVPAGRTKRAGFESTGKNCTGTCPVRPCWPDTDLALATIREVTLGGSGSANRPHETLV